MCQLKKNIKLYYSDDDVDIDDLKERLVLNEYEISPHKVRNDFKADELSIFISRPIEKKYFFKLGEFLDTQEPWGEEIFFIYPKIQCVNNFFSHEELSKYKESYVFSGLSFSFSFMPKTKNTTTNYFLLNKGAQHFF